MIPAAGAPGTAGSGFRVAREAADDVAGRLASMDEQQWQNRLREELDDAVLMRTGRSIGDIASAEVVEAVWPLVQLIAAEAYGEGRDDEAEGVPIRSWVAAAVDGAR